MNTNILLLIPFLTATAVLVIAPRLGFRRIFFGVRVDAAFRSSEAARRALRRYELALGTTAIVGIAWILFRRAGVGQVIVPPVLLFISGIASGVWNRHSLRKYAVSSPAVVNVELGTEPDRVPTFLWLSAIPPVVLAVTALYLRSHWADIPLRYPTHWGANGQPNGWTTRSLRGVYGPLLFAAMWMGWLTAMAFITWFCSRRSPMRTASAKVVIACEFLFAVVAPVIALMPIWRPKPELLVVLIIGAVVGIVVFSIATFSRAAAQPANDVVRVADCRAVCFNRNDPSLLLPRADGLGYAPNFAHPAAWLLALAPFVIVFIGLKFIF